MPIWPIPDRKDGKRSTPRNSMSLVNINIATKHGVLFHFDGEFNSMDDLVRGTLTGRNYGWLADESEQAMQHVAKIIREDDGQDELGKEFGGSYRKLLAGKEKNIPEEFHGRFESFIATNDELTIQRKYEIAQLLTKSLSGL